MLRLDATTRKLTAVLGGAVTTNQLPIVVCYSDKTATAYSGGTAVTATNSGTPVDVCDAPGASTVRDIDSILVVNSDTAAATLTLTYDDNSTPYTLFKATLAMGDQAVYAHGAGWKILDSAGNVKSIFSLPGLTIAAGKFVVINNSLTLGGTDGTTMTFPTATASLVGKATTDTLTNKRFTPRVGSTTSSATPTINTDDVDVYKLTAQTADITSFTTNLSGTPSDNDVLIIEITGTAARAITWGASFEASTVALPTTTVSTNMLAVAFIYNTATSKWRCVASV
jgi:hypothetical protein